LFDLNYPRASEIGILDLFKTFSKKNIELENIFSLALVFPQSFANDSIVE